MGGRERTTESAWQGGIFRHGQANLCWMGALANSSNVGKRRMRVTSSARSVCGRAKVSRSRSARAVGGVGSKRPNETLLVLPSGRRRQQASCAFVT